MLKSAISIQRKVSFRQGRGGASKEVLRIKQDVAAEDLEKFLDSEVDDSPILVAFLSVASNCIELLAITGDKILITIDSTDIIEGILGLLSVYYVFDLSYPRMYCQFLGLMQHIILGDIYEGKKSQGFLNVMYQMAIK